MLNKAVVPWTYDYSSHCCLYTYQGKVNDVDVELRRLETGTVLEIQLITCQKYE